MVPAPKSAEPLAPPSGEEATLLSPGRPPSVERMRLRRGQAVARFMVVDRLGAGAMGEVVSAYDPDLHRRVAIKVLRASEDGSTGADSTERMLREARAMAQLAHPNVITVFEVDKLDDGQLFIAMEYVDGGTLRGWAQRERPRTWPEVLAVYLQAGRGLAAAHSAGMIHRDFKPDNVLIGSDGRVRVTDFGLVGVDSALDDIDATDEPGLESSGLTSTGGSSARRAVVDVTLTRTGAIMGTPAYMSPEQGKNIDARSDQFSFCVALYEALHGERPFAGDNLADLRFNVMKGRIRERPRRSDVPAWLRAVVVRGLAVDPSERWASMPELLAMLERDPTVRRRRIAGGGAGMLAVGGLVAWAAFAAPEPVDKCGGGQARFAEVWGAERSEQMLAGLEGVSPEQAAELHAGLVGALDGFGETWIAERRDACEANKVRQAESDDLFDRRMRCLNRRLEKVDALLSVFEPPSAETVGNVELVGGRLPPLETCSDAEALAAQVPPPEEAQAREIWDRLHRELDRADALGVAGKEVASLSLYEALAPEVAQLQHAPLTARLMLNHGNALVRQQRWVEAIAVLDPGPGVAAEAGDATVEAQMWLLLAKATGFGLNDAKSGATMARAAEVAAVRAGDVPDVEIGIQYTLSLLRDADGDYEAAVEHADRAVKLAIAEHGREHRTTSTLYGNLGSVLEHAGRYDDAMAANETSLQIDIAQHGESHPDVGHSLVNIGVLLQNKGEYDQARLKFERALSIYEGTVGRKHGAYTTAMVNLGQNAFYRQEFAEARDRFVTLLELYRQTMPEVSDDIAMVHQNLGTAYKHLEDLVESEKHYRQAYRIRQQVFGDEHPKVMHSINAMAMVLAHKGEFEASEKELRRAIAIGEKAFPDNHPDLAYPVQNLGDVLAEQGRYKEALPFMERAVQLRADINPKLLGHSEFALARVLCFVDREAGEKMLDQAAAKMDAQGKKEVQRFRTTL